MKPYVKAIVLAMMMGACIPQAFALDPEECGKARGRYTNLSFVSSTLDQKGYPKLDSNVGFSFTKGNTYYLHKPIAGCLRFGIDATWIDLSYTQYKVEERVFDTSNQSFTTYNKYSVNEVDFAMQIGASATVNLFKRFQANAYFRYSPTMMLMVNDEELQAGFANFFNPGLSVTYGRVGLGIEARFGSSKMSSYFVEDDYDDDYDFDSSDDWTDALGKKKVSTKLTGLRAYITFRF